MLTSLKIVSHRIPVRWRCWRTRRYYSNAYNLQSSIREAFLDVQSSLSLLDQGDNQLQSTLEKIHELTNELEDESIWIREYAAASKKQQILSQLRKQSESLLDIQSSVNELRELKSIAESCKDLQLYQDILPELLSLKFRAAELAKALMLSHQDDINSAYIEIKAGSGGTEACDWAAMLSRMYTRWAQSRSFSVSIVDESAGDVAGIRSRTLLVEGPYAFGYAQFESGIHRLVRISPFDGAGQRHTSFASVQVSPHFPEANGNEKSWTDLNPADLHITTMRSQGAGGQHVNKTESAVRIVHLPTNIVVACQQERSQSRNRALAMSLLKAKLYDMERLKKAQAKTHSHNNLPEITWGAQIRSYTLQPYQLIKDIRTGHEVGTGGVQSVLDGDLDGLMEASLRHFRTPKPRAAS